MNEFYDTHAHLDYPEFVTDFPEIIERARAAGISRIISIGTDLESSRRAIAMSERFENVFAVAGWHPTNVNEAPKDFRDDLRALANYPKVVALGETGLDYHRLPLTPPLPPNRPLTPALAPKGEREDSPPATGGEVEVYKEKQARLFEQHLEVAAELGLNCVIHQRDAMEDTLKMMERFKGRVRGVFHCFSDGPAAMRRILDLGSIVSYTGIVTFKNAQTVRDSVVATPLGSFMLETDCPYLAPVPYRGKRCEPAYVKEIAGVIAEVKECTLETLSAETCATAAKFFPKLA